MLFPSESLSKASDANFAKINSNFGQELLNKRKLQSDMQTLSQGLVTELTTAQQNKANLLAYHITIHFQHIRSIYIESMQDLISGIEAPAAFLFMRNLIYNIKHFLL